MQVLINEEFLEPWKYKPKKKKIVVPVQQTTLN